LPHDNFSRDSGSAQQAPLDFYMTDNLNAFPGSAALGYKPGMTLRDWFAGQALTGLISGLHSDGSHFHIENDPPKHALAAYQMADAMLEARAK